LLDPMADDPAIAVRTVRCQRMDRALEAVEGVGAAVLRDLERLVVVVAADVALRHGFLLARFRAADAAFGNGRRRVMFPCPTSVLRCGMPCRGRRWTRPRP